MLSVSGAGPEHVGNAVTLLKWSWLIKWWVAQDVVDCDGRQKGNGHRALVNSHWPTKFHTEGKEDLGQRSIMEGSQTNIGGHEATKEREHFLGDWKMAHLPFLALSWGCIFAHLFPVSTATFLNTAWGSSTDQSDICLSLAKALSGPT